MGMLLSYSYLRLNVATQYLHVPPDTYTTFIKMCSFVEQLPVDALTHHFELMFIGLFSFTPFPHN